MLLAAITRAPRRIAFTSVRKSRWRALAFNEFIESQRAGVAYRGPLPRPHRRDAAPVPRCSRRRNDARRSCTSRTRSSTPAARARRNTGSRSAGPSVIEHLRGLGLACVLTGGSDPAEAAHLRRSSAPGRGAAAESRRKDRLGRARRRRRRSAGGDQRRYRRRSPRRCFRPAADRPLRTDESRALAPPARRRRGAFPPRSPMRRSLHFEPRLRGAPMDRLSTALVIHATDELLSQTHVRI